MKMKSCINVFLAIVVMIIVIIFDILQPDSKIIGYVSSRSLSKCNEYLHENKGNIRIIGHAGFNLKTSLPYEREFSKEQVAKITEILLKAKNANAPRHRTICYNWILLEVFNLEDYIFTIKIRFQEKLEDGSIDLKKDNIHGFMEIFSDKTSSADFGFFIGGCFRSEELISYVYPILEDLILLIEDDW